MGANDSNDNLSREKQSSKRTNVFSYQWVYLFLFVGLLIMYFMNRGESRIIETSWMKFKNEMLLDRDVEKINVINNERVEVYIKSESLKKDKYKTIVQMWNNTLNSGPHYFFTIGSIDFFEQQLMNAQSEFNEADRIEEFYVRRGNWWLDLLSWVFPLGLLILIWSFWNRLGNIRRSMGGGSLFDFGKSQAHEYVTGRKSSVSFKDIAGYEEAKVEIMEVVEFLKHPEQFTRLGAKIPKGVLLLGPPGTGKTHMAKAVAGEAGVPFFSLSGSEFVEMFVGVGAARVRDLFNKAKQRAPSIVFIDEIDAIGRVRGTSVSIQTNDERESTLNQLLAEMDGFDANTNVIVIAATNRPDILDNALLRPGRFDRQIFLELPDKLEREAIFKVHMKPLIVDKSIDIDYIISQTPGFSGADIANLCNEAALIAARNKKDSITKQDFIDAIDRIIGGLQKKNKLVSPKERKVIAYHEAGHAIVSWMLNNVDSIIKVSIIPRGRSLGSAMYLPEEHQIVTYSQFIDHICAALGGRTAEEIVFKEASSGALDDLEKVTKQAYAMVTNLGLSEKIGSISFRDSTGDYRSFQKPYSEETAKLIDLEVRTLVEDAHKRAKEILIEHRNELNDVAELLLQKEVIYKDELETILGKREPLISEKNI